MNYLNFGVFFGFISAGLAGCSQQDATNPDAAPADARVSADLSAPADASMAGDLSTSSSPDLTGITTLRYAANSIKLPSTMAPYAIDIDGGGHPQNQFKQIVSTIMLAGFDLQGPVDKQVSSGQTVVLMDIASNDLKNACGDLSLDSPCPLPRRPATTAPIASTSIPWCPPPTCPSAPPPAA